MFKILLCLVALIVSLDAISISAKNAEDIRIKNEQNKFTPFKVEPFLLPTDLGEKFSSISLAEDTWVVAFIFTRCLGACPMMISRMKELPQPGLGRKLNFLAISVDPEHDRPDVLKKYRSKRSLSKKSWRLATGPREDLVRVAKDIFKRPVTVQKQHKNQLILHSEELLLVRKGMVLGAYNYSDPRQLSILKSRIHSGL